MLFFLIFNRYTLDLLLQKKQQCYCFFNYFTNLNKLVSYEQRDPFAIRNELLEHPDFSDWDKFAQNEYQRLAAEEENPENVDIKKWMNEWLKNII